MLQFSLLLLTSVVSVLFFSQDVVGHLERSFAYHWVSQWERSSIARTTQVCYATTPGVNLCANVCTSIVVSIKLLPTPLLKSTYFVCLVVEWVVDEGNSKSHCLWVRWQYLVLYNLNEWWHIQISNSDFNNRMTLMQMLDLWGCCTWISKHVFFDCRPF